MKSRPWIWIWVAFLLFVAALGWTLVIAERNKQPTVPLDPPPAHADR